MFLKINRKKLYYFFLGLKKYVQNIAKQIIINIPIIKYSVEYFKLELLKLLNTARLVLFNNLLKIGIKIIAYNIEKIVCNILDIMYMFIFMSDLYIILEV